MRMKYCVVFTILIISIEAKSYSKSEEFDEISVNKTESDSEQKMNFGQICQEIRGFTQYNENRRRFKRAYSTEQFVGHLQGVQFQKVVIFDREHR